jgi:tetratricopeptide (TPR) repeat protein
VDDHPFDVSYRYDAAYRPVPNDAAGMARAAAVYVERARDPKRSPAEAARDLGRAGMYQAMIGDLGSAEETLREALRRSEALGDARLGVALRLRLGQVYQWQGRYVEADTLFSDEIAACRGDVDLAAAYLDFALQHAGKSRLDQGRFDDAVGFFEEALEIRLARGDATLVSSTRDVLDYARRCRESASPAEGEP